MDLIYFPDPVGGLKQAFKILEEQTTSKKIDVKKFIRYTLSFPVKSVQKQIGYALDECLADKKLLEPLAKKLKDTSLTTLYGSKSRKGTINNKWRVILDAS